MTVIYEVEYTANKRLSGCLLGQLLNKSHCLTVIVQSALESDDMAVLSVEVVRLDRAGNVRAKIGYLFDFLG